MPNKEDEIYAIEEESIIKTESIDNETQEKEHDYIIKIQEKEIEIERLENIALNDENDYEALENYKLAKDEYKRLLKEYKQFKKDTKVLTNWDLVPKRMKIFASVVGVVCFPFLMWETLPLWYYPYLAFYNIFENPLNKLFDEDLKAIGYGLLGTMWYIVPLILIIIWIKLFFSKTKTLDNKKPYMILWFLEIILILMLLTYQIIMMIENW